MRKKRVGRRGGASSTLHHERARLEWATSWRLTAPASHAAARRSRAPPVRPLARHSSSPVSISQFALSRVSLSSSPRRFLHSVFDPGDFTWRGVQIVLVGGWLVEDFAWIPGAPARPSGGTQSQEGSVRAHLQQPARLLMRFGEGSLPASLFLLVGSSSRRCEQF